MTYYSSYICVQFSDASNLFCIAAVDPGFFAPWSYIFQFIISHTRMWAFLHQEGKVFFHIQTKRLGHFHHRINCGAGLSSSRGIAEQPVAAPYGYGSDTVLAHVIGKTTATILQIIFGIWPLVSGIDNRLIHPRSLNWALFLQLGPERFQDFGSLLVSVSMPLFIAIIIFPAISFNGKQLVTIHYALDCRLRQITLLLGRNGITKLPTDMGPTGFAHNIRQMLYP